MDNVVKRASWPVAGFMVWMLALSVQAEDGMWLDVTPLAAEELAGSSGRQGVQIQLNNTEQNALLAGNVMNGNVVSGDNLISDNAFQNMSGTATVIQNSGSYVVIQDSTQINILFNNY